jgi:hypothetical protein
MFREVVVMSRGDEVVFRSNEALLRRDEASSSLSTAGASEELSEV